MIPLNWRSAFMAFVVLIESPASSAIAAAPATQKAFETPDAFVGQEVELRGYLLYRFENKNLYPNSSWHDESMKKRCIPIGVDVSRKELPARAQSLDGTYVVVRGKVLQLVGENQLNASFCKDVGILLENIEPAK
jgi:hypothetical protein